MATVLCPGADRTLIETRTLNPGHKVVWATGEPQLIEACAHHKLDVAVSRAIYFRRREAARVQPSPAISPSAKISRRALSEADVWLEVPAQVPTDLAVHIERLTPNVDLFFV
jgi:hypothetical protein